MHLHLPQINTSTDTWYTPYHSGCSWAQRSLFWAAFLQHPPDPSACLACVFSHCDAVHLWAEVIKVYAGATVAGSKLHTWPRRCCLLETGPILWSTIKFHISNFAGEKKWSTTFLYSLQENLLGAEQSLCNREKLWGSPPFPVSPGSISFHILLYLQRTCVYARPPIFIMDNFFFVPSPCFILIFANLACILSDTKSPRMWEHEHHRNFKYQYIHHVLLPLSSIATSFNHNFFITSLQAHFQCN